MGGLNNARAVGADEISTRTALSIVIMIDTDAFCPKSGAPLSDERHYDDSGDAKRAVVADERLDETPPVGELTNGAVRSSKTALFNYFRLRHQRRFDADDALYRKASLVFTRLKRAATGREGWDVHVWYAAQRRLADAGYDTGWMHAHVTPRCPYCHGRLGYTQFANGDVIARCGTNCTDRRDDRLAEIRGILAGLYTRAFPDANDSINADSFLQF